MFVKENEASFEIFGKILFVVMKSSKLNNYLIETRQTCYSNMVIILVTIFFLRVCTENEVRCGFEFWV
jgi:hypothetical protein